jgi:hypothetical protein
METNTDSNDTVQNYCIARGLNFYTREELELDWGGPEEWEGVLCAGLDDNGTAFIVREDDGRIKLVTAYADGHRRMEDEWTYFAEEAIRSGKAFRAE